MKLGIPILKLYNATDINNAVNYLYDHGYTYYNHQARKSGLESAANKAINYDPPYCLYLFFALTGEKFFYINDYNYIKMTIPKDRGLILMNSIRQFIQYSKKVER